MAIRSVSIAAPSLGGGGMIRAYFLADLLRHIGIDVEIFAHLPAGRSIYPTPPSELALTTIAGDRIWNFGPRLARRLTGDAILAVKPRTSSFGISLLATLRSKQPLALDVDDWESSYAIRGVSRRLKLGVLERMMGFADEVIVNNTYLQRRYGGTLLASGRDGRLFDPRKYDSEACRQSLGLQGHTVLMVPGTVVAHSGIEDLLAAMDRLPREDLILVIVGGRSCGAEYVATKLGRWSGKIRHLPEFPRDQLPAVLAAAHMFVVPHRDTRTSRHNFPMKLIDGMAMAKPILATRVGDIPKALDGVGYLTAPSAPRDLADTLERVLGDPKEAARRGRLARQRFDQAYSLDALAPTMAELLARLSRLRY